MLSASECAAFSATHESMSEEKKTAPALFAGAVVDNGSKAIDGGSMGPAVGETVRTGRTRAIRSVQDTNDTHDSQNSAMRLEGTHKSTDEKRGIYSIMESAQLQKRQRERNQWGRVVS